MDSKVQKIKESKKIKRKTRRKVFMLLIVSVGVIVFLYKAPIFNIKDISFGGLISIKEETLDKVLSEELGKNIFSVDYNSIREKLLINPYIKDVSIKRSGINKLKIDVKENDIAFYIDGPSKNIVNSNLILVETLENVEDKNLVKLLGVDSEGKKVGDKISDNQDILNVISKLYSIIEASPPEYRFKWVDLTDLSNIKGQIGDVEVKLGSVDNIISKMNTVLNIIEQKGVTKGYIDISFNGPAVIKQEK